MRSDSLAADVIIIGGGFSGTMVAAELARRGVGSVLVDGSGREGRGTAYSTPEDAHLLNVVAGRMGAWADKPGDFAGAVAADGYAADAYVPRRRYGEYLSNILHEVRSCGLVTLVSSDARAAERAEDGWAVQLADGSRIAGRALVLAQGNQTPQPPSLARSLPAELFVNDPWSDASRAAVARAAAGGGDVLIIGTGLTMVDVALSLDEARHRGRIVALSRRGLVPRAHAAPSASSGQDSMPAPVALDEVPQGSLARLWRWLRRRGAEVGWRAAVDGLRPHSQALWQALGEGDQRRFLRHARPWWDVHRHRIAPEVAGRIRRLIELGQLEIVAGRIIDMWADGGQLAVRIARRGRPTPSPSLSREGSRFALAVNCTGPLGSISDSGDPLLKGLFEAGLARPDALDLGLEVDERSRIVPRHARDERMLAWAVGPLTKGRYWEITAVPDIRGQVARVADDIAKELEDAVQS